MEPTPSTPETAANHGLTDFSVSDSATRRIAHLLSDEPAGSYFRVQVQGGGCSGFQYHFDISATQPADDDHVIRKDGATVVIDETSLGVLKGSAIDYVEELGSAGFEIKNPNATAKCGCGNSFAV